jgi:hypothetical protein
VGYLLFELPGLGKARNLYLNSLGGISVCHKYSVTAQMKMKIKVDDDDDDSGGGGGDRWHG